MKKIIKSLSIILITLLLFMGCTSKTEENIYITRNNKHIETNEVQKVYKAQVYTILDNSNINKVENVKLAINSINEIKIKSGEEFSFNNIVGERTSEKGYKEASVIYVNSKGQSYKGLGVGGGICQVSSTIYMACKKLSLEILERRPHTSRVDYCSIEDEAMINWGTSDFRFKNNLDEDIIIKLYLFPVEENNYEQKLICEIW